MKQRSRWIVTVDRKIIAGPFGQTEAQNLVRQLDARYLRMGMQPPPMNAQRLHTPEWLESWVTEDIQRKCTGPEPVREGLVCVDPRCPAGHAHTGRCPGPHRKDPQDA